MFCTCANFLSLDRFPHQGQPGGQLADFRRPQIKNANGDLVGEIIADFELTEVEEPKSSAGGMSLG